MKKNDFVEIAVTMIKAKTKGVKVASLGRNLEAVLLPALLVASSGKVAEASWSRLDLGSLVTKWRDASPTNNLA